MNFSIVLFALFLSVLTVFASDVDPLDHQFEDCCKKHKLMKSLWHQMDSSSRTSRVNSFLAIAIKEENIDAIKWLLKQPESVTVDLKELAQSDVVVKVKANWHIKKLISQFLKQEELFYNRCEDYHSFNSETRKFYEEKYFRPACIPEGFKIALDARCHKSMEAILKSPYKDLLSQEILFAALKFACEARTENLVGLLLELTEIQNEDVNFVEIVIINEGYNAYLENSFIILTLLSDHRINPGMNDNAALKQAYKFGNIPILSILLAHPSVDQHSLDEIVKQESPDTAGNGVHGFIRLLGTLLDAARSGDLDAIRGGTIPKIALTTLFKAACFHGHFPIVKLLHRFVALIEHSDRDFYSVLFCLDQPEIASFLINMEVREEKLITMEKHLNRLLGKALNFRAQKSVRYIHGYIDNLDKTEEFTNLLLGLENLDAPDFNSKINLFIVYVKWKWNEMPNILRHYVFRATIQLWKYHVKHSGIILPELGDRIASYLETTRPTINAFIALNL